MLALARRAPHAPAPPLRALWRRVVAALEALPLPGRRGTWADAVWGGTWAATAAGGGRFAAPRFWAGFVVAGARTALPPLCGTAPAPSGTAAAAGPDGCAGPGGEEGAVGTEAERTQAGAAMARGTAAAAAVPQRWPPPPPGPGPAWLLAAAAAVLVCAAAALALARRSGPRA